jgi:pyruvate-formate lyase
MLPNLIKTYFESGGWHLAVNTVDAEILQKAKVNPAYYTEVLVKISGYSAKFVRLDEQLQNAIIERAKKA